MVLFLFITTMENNIIICKRTVIMEDGVEAFTKNDLYLSYPSNNVNEFMLVNNQNSLHTFTKTYYYEHFQFIELTKEKLSQITTNEFAITFKGASLKVSISEESKELYLFDWKSKNENKREFTELLNYSLNYLKRVYPNYVIVAYTSNPKAANIAAKFGKVKNYLTIYEF